MFAKNSLKTRELYGATDNAGMHEME